ncbi:MAG: DoxX family protein [Thermoanaerobaculia bacterium]
MRFLERYIEPIYALFRIIFGLLFASHGAQKLFGMFGGIDGKGTPLGPEGGLGYVAGWIELVTGLLIALGLFTGIAAFLASGTMAAAYFIGHAKGGFWPLVNQGELAVLFCFAFLYMAARGSGRYSVDGMRRGTAAPARR